MPYDVISIVCRLPIDSDPDAKPGRLSPHSEISERAWRHVLSFRRSDYNAHTLTEDTREETEAEKLLPAGLVFTIAGAEKAATREADADWREPALAATRAVAAVMEAATILLN
jgi:hypothetical protein